MHHPHVHAEQDEPEGEGGGQPGPPPPRHAGLRRFLREFVGVTMGVLLALILEQAVEYWRERERVFDTRASMDEEVADFAEIDSLRMRLDPCVRRKLDQLDAFVAGRGPRAPLRNVGRPNYYFSSRGAWNSNVADQLARHFGAATVKQYGELYQGMNEYLSLSRDEQTAWVTLQTLEGDADPIDPQRKARLREAIAQARNLHLLLAATASQMLKDAHIVGVAPNGTLRGLKIRSAPICLPLATAPA
ncbi:MAG: hypothetical protein QOH81_413 [Sphingomonadales bacterium]|jgi:hypothetical protein|nr:hypothetical protein [Sphingomonadales bacterium]